MDTTASGLHPGPSSFRPLSAEAGPSRRARGRPRKEINPVLMRKIIRLHVRTPITFDAIAGAVEICFGITKLNLRLKLSEALGLDDVDLLLSDMKIQHENSTGLDEGQRRAYEYLTGPKSSISPETSTSPAATERSATLGVTPESPEFDHFVDYETYALSSTSRQQATNTIEADAAGKKGQDIYQVRSPMQQEDNAVTPHDLFLAICSKVKEKHRDAVMLLGRHGTAEKSSTQVTCLTRIGTGTWVPFRRTSEYEHYRRPDSKTWTASRSTERLGMPASTVRFGDGEQPEQESLVYLLTTLSHQEIVQCLNRRIQDEDETSVKQWINTADKRGITPLFLAVAYGYRDICQKLITRGADIHAKSNKETSIYHFAKRAEHDARNDIKLYASIVICRQAVKCKKSPPVPGLGHPKGKHRATESTPPDRCEKRSTLSSSHGGLYPKRRNMHDNHLHNSTRAELAQRPNMAHYFTEPSLPFTQCIPETGQGVVHEQEVTAPAHAYVGGPTPIMSKFYCESPQAASSLSVEHAADSFNRHTLRNPGRQGAHHHQPSVEYESAQTDVQQQIAPHLEILSSHYDHDDYLQGNNQSGVSAMSPLLESSSNLRPPFVNHRQRSTDADSGYGPSHKRHSGATSSANSMATSYHIPAVPSFLQPDQPTLQPRSAGSDAHVTGTGCVMLSCPGCGTPILVPTGPHPEETGDSLTISCPMQAYCSYGPFQVLKSDLRTQLGR